MAIPRIAPLLLVLATTGCAQFRSPVAWFLNDMPTETVKNPVDRIVGVWQETNGKGMNGLPTRGFGGQILFFPRKGETPVKVEGDVRVYVFDDVGSAEEQAKPIHQFDFKGGSWNAQLVKGSLGPTYQVFLPYTRRGSHEARCAIRLRYTPEVGAAVYSDPIDVRLRGEEKPDDEVADSAVAERTRSIDTIRLERARVDAGATPRTTVAPGTTGATTDVDVQAVRIERLERMIQQLTAERRLGAAPQPNRPLTETPDESRGGIRPVSHIVPAEPTNDAGKVSNHPLGKPGPRVTGRPDPHATLPDVTATSAASPKRRYQLGRNRVEPTLNAGRATVGRERTLREPFSLASTSATGTATKIGGVDVDSPLPPTDPVTDGGLRTTAPLVPKATIWEEAEAER